MKRFVFLLLVPIIMMGAGCQSTGKDKTVNYAPAEVLSEKTDEFSSGETIWRGTAEITSSYVYSTDRGSSCLNPEGAELEKLPDMPESICFSNNSKMVAELGAPKDSSEAVTTNTNFGGSGTFVIGDLIRYDSPLGVLYVTKLLEIK